MKKSISTESILTSINQVEDNRKKFRVDHFDIVIGEYIGRLNRGKVILNPPYQRTFRWDIETQSQLIESVIIGLPLPPIFVFSNPDKRWEVIDGVQRTTTFQNFLNDETGKFKLTGCEILTELNGKSFKELPEYIQGILEDVRLRIEIIEDTVDIESQYLLFSRLNSNGIHLSPQELRNFLIYKLNPKFFNKLDELRKKKYFQDALSLSEHRNEAQEDIEYIIKFFLCRNFVINGQHSTSYSKIDVLITSEIKLLLEDPKINIDQEIEIFQDTFKFLYDLFGKNVFRYFESKTNSIANRFSLCIGMSFFVKELKKLPKEHLLNLTKNYYSTSGYKNLTKQGYSPTKRIFELSRYSYDYFKKILEGASYEI